MNRLIETIEQYRAAVIGVLVVFFTSVAWEISGRVVYVVFGVVLTLFAVRIAKSTATHFHGHHHHVGDSVIDALPLSVLFLANILHPAVDGLSFWEIFVRDGNAAGILFGLGVVLHEIVRQTAMIAVFKQMGIKWYWVVATAFIGIVSGIGAAIGNATFFHTYEYVADLATLFAYAFIIAEFRYAGHGIKKNWKFLAVGVLVGVVFVGFVGR